MYGRSAGPWSEHSLAWLAPQPGPRPQEAEARVDCAVHHAALRYARAPPGLLGSQTLPVGPAQGGKGFVGPQQATKGGLGCSPPAASPAAAAAEGARSANRWPPRQPKGARSGDSCRQGSAEVADSADSHCDWYPLVEEVTQYVEECSEAGTWLDANVQQYHASMLPVELVSKTFYHQLVKLSADSHNPDSADAVLRCFEAMLQMDIHPDRQTVNLLLHTCARCGRINLAEQLWSVLFHQHADKFKPDSVTYNIMINACAQGKDASRAGIWLKRMLDAGIKPSLVTFGSVIGLWVKTGRLHEAETCAQSMKDYGLSFDRVICNSMVDGYVKAGQPAQAERWFMHLVKSDNMSPDVKAYNSMIHMCAKAGDLRGAERWFAAMEDDPDCQADMISLSSMIYASARAGSVERAEHWMMEILARRFTPNVICFNTLFYACARRGNSATAVHWFSQMLRSNVKPNNVTFNSLIDLSTEARDMAATEFFLHMMITLGFHPDGATCMTLSRGPRVARRRSGSSWGKGQRHSTLQVTEKAFSTIIRAYLQVGNEAQAKHWLVEMTKAGYQFAGPVPSQDHSNVMSPDEART